MDLISLSILKSQLSSIKNNLNYNNLKDKPVINDVEIAGELSLSDLGIYSKEEVDQFLDLIPKFKVEVVQSLPSENINNTTIYLIPSDNESPNMFTEYIFINNNWEKIGEQNLDLSEYVKSTDYATNNKAGIIRAGGRLKVENDGILKGIEMGESEIDNGDPSNFICSGSLKGYVKSKLTGKQDKLTAGSGINIDENNVISLDLPIYSGGVIE